MSYIPAATLDTYVKDTGDTMTGPLVMSNSMLDMAASSPSWTPLRIRVASKTQWEIGSGGSGTRLDFDRFDDSGNYANTPFQIYRSSGLVNVTGALGVGSDANVGGYLIAQGANFSRGVNNAVNMVFQTNNVNRWAMGKGPGTETGTGNSGAEFNISAWDDAGNWLSNPISIRRADAQITMNGHLYLHGNIHMEDQDVYAGWLEGSYGGWLGGQMTQDTAPVNTGHLANKAYVDTKWTKWTGTQAAYDAIVTKDANTLYAIIG